MYDTQILNKNMKKLQLKVEKDCKSSTISKTKYKQMNIFKIAQPFINC